MYIKDKKTGESYSANRNYNDLPFEKHHAHVGLGYHTVVSEYKGICTEFSLLVPTTGVVMQYKVKIKNTGEEDKDLSVYFTLNPVVHLTPHSAYGYGDYFEEYSGFVFDHTAFALNEPYKKIYVGCTEKCDSYEVDDDSFRGIYNGYHNPEGVKQEKLCSEYRDFCGKYIAAFQFDLHLERGAEKEYYFIATAIKDVEEIKTLKTSCLSKEKFEKEYEKQRVENEKYLGVFKVDTPDEYFNSQANIWLKRQLSLGKTWGRVYGKGYRDVMQDITAFISLDTRLARKRILYAMKYQYEDGNSIRMFEPNFHYPYNDGGVWMTGAVLSYLNETADVSILKERATYLKGNSYDNSEYSDSFVFEPYIAGDRKDDTVLDHLKSAIDYLLNCRGKTQSYTLAWWRLER